jgi:DNA-binding LacI/PurR family transcriptional regulator
MTVIVGNKIPMYSQIAQAIKQRVRSGVYKSGEVLPSVRTISKEFGVSVKAVHQAVHTLEESGIVKTHPGKGMIVTNEENCERAAIIFGLIHPYISSMGFHREVLEYVDEAFSERSNFIIVRSSKDNPALERDIAQHLLTNGVKGLIVWPTNNDPNGEYFQDLSHKVPVVLVDRLLQGADLPNVLLDYYACGREISETLLEKMNAKRLLVLMDNLQISSYQYIIQGIESAASELERAKDLTIVQLPISRIIQKVTMQDFSEIISTAEIIERMINEGKYDAVFCPQNDFIEYVMIQTGMIEKFEAVQLATFWCSDANVRSMRYCKQRPLEWHSNSAEMISQAADLVQRWVLSRQVPSDVIRVKLRLVEKRA